MSDKLNDAIGRVKRMVDDVRPMILVVQNALNMTIDVVETLRKQGYFGVNKGLDMLLDFLMDGGVVAEFSAMLGMFLQAITIFLECVQMAINLFNRFKKSELGRNIIKFLSEKLFTLAPRYALAA